MDDQGNILVKRVSKSNVYVKSTSEGEENSIGAEILKLSNCALELEKPVKVSTTIFGSTFLYIMKNLYCQRFSRFLELITCYYIS